MDHRRFLTSVGAALATPSLNAAAPIAAQAPAASEISAKPRNLLRALATFVQFENALAKGNRDGSHTPTFP